MVPASYLPKSHGPPRHRQNKKSPERTYGQLDLPAIVEASRHNELRFQRDYKGQGFTAFGHLNRVSESWTAGEMLVYVDTSQSADTVFCFVKIGAATVADWPTRMPMKISGIITDTSFSDLKLSDCKIERDR